MSAPLGKTINPPLRQRVYELHLPYYADWALCHRVWISVCSGENCERVSATAALGFLLYVWIMKEIHAGWLCFPMQCQYEAIVDVQPDARRTLCTCTTYVTGAVHQRAKPQNWGRIVASFWNWKKIVATLEEVGIRWHCGWCVRPWPVTAPYCSCAYLHLEDASCSFRARPTCRTTDAGCQNYCTVVDQLLQK